MQLSRLQVIYYSFFAAFSHEAVASSMHKSSVKRSLMLQEAERHYVKACHELRLLAAPLPFKVSQGCCSDRILKEENQGSGNVVNQQYAMQTPIIPLSPIQLHFSNSRKAQCRVSSDSLDHKAKDAKNFGKDDGKVLNQLLPNGLLSLRLTGKPNIGTDDLHDKTNKTQNRTDVRDNATTEQTLLRKQRIMSLEYDVRKCISDVRAQQSQVNLRRATNGSAPTDEGHALASPDSYSDVYSPMRSLSIEDRIQRGRRRGWKRERFCSRKYEQLCADVLCELEKKEKRIYSEGVDLMDRE